MEEEKKIPCHVAIVLDGNGRWAKQRHLPRKLGHKQGAKAVEDICEDAWNLGIKYLTVYAFSTENWSRSEDEVSAIMDLLRNYLKDCIKRSMKNNMRVRIIGDKTRLDTDIQEQIAELEKITSGNTGLNFTIAINYGGRDELVRAVKKYSEAVKNGKEEPGELTPEKLENYLDTAGMPPVDFFIRTSGEQRVSNFLLWQIAYAEMYFPEVLWPDFNKKELIKALEYYASRDRRFGGRKSE